MGLSRDKALSIASLSKHAYYYKPKKGKRGVQPSRTTMHCNDYVSNDKVVNEIESILSDPDLAYGYHKMTKSLKLLGYKIGKHKVYRLMKEHNLLQSRYKKKQVVYAQYRKVMPLNPYELIEMDIKFQWIEQVKRHAYILTILDVFSRKVLKWHVAMSITQHTISEVWTDVITDYLQPLDLLNKGVHIEIRNDNDPRFKAKSIQRFFEQNYLNQVFTHPYTPQENGHIESFHAILGRSLDRRSFFDLEELEIHLTLFYEKYNNIRLHSSIASLPPNTYLKLWENNQIMLCVDTKNRRITPKLRIPYHQVILSGIEKPKEASCSDLNSFNRSKNQQSIKANGATAIQPSVQRSPSVASC